MPAELARPTSPLVRPARSLVSALGSAAPGLLWRALHPLARERFVDGPPLAPLDRLVARTDDGWALELRALPTAPRAPGEPVLLLPTLGASADLFRCGEGATLASRLVDGGFRVFLGAHRGTSEATPPSRGASPAFDDVARHDVAALIDAAIERSGYPRVHVVGHGLGGQATLAALARRGERGVASVAVLSTPVVFPRTPPGLRRLAGAVDALPGRWTVPARRLARWSAVLLDPSGDGRAPRRRAGLTRGVDDIPLALLAQVGAWLEAGALCDRGGEHEHALALGDVRAPLWLGHGDGDGLCPASWALPLRDAWRRGAVDVHRWETPLDHLDVVLHPAAGAQVHAPLVAWLERHRARAWLADGPRAGVEHVP